MFDTALFTLVVLTIIGYLAGSLSAAIITCRLMGLEDPRNSGSKNPGATNVLRIGGKKAAIITLLGDMLKGLVPVLAVNLTGFPVDVIAAVAVAAFLGHLFPVFFGFTGGKGVATFLGAIIGIDWMIGLAVIATWLAMALVFRYSSLAALVAATLSNLYIFLITDSTELLTASIIMSSLLVWRHTGNISRLLKGEEDRIGSRKPD